MNEIFNFHGQEVRTLTIDDEPWFVGKDVADILGYQNGSRDINRHVDEEDRQNYQNGTFGNRGVTVINESGLYSLILSSKLPQAREFKRWVTSDVLPAIRKQGGFIREDLDEEALWLAWVVLTVQLMLTKSSLNLSSGKQRLISRIILISVAMTYCQRNSQKQR